MHERIHAEALARNKQVPDRRDTTKMVPLHPHMATTSDRSGEH